MEFEDYVAKYIFLKIVRNINIPCIFDEEFGIVSEGEREAEDQIIEKHYYCSLCNENFISNGEEDALIKEHYINHNKKEFLE